MCHTSICEGAHIQHFWKTLVCRPFCPSTLPKNTKTTELQKNTVALTCFFFVFFFKWQIWWSCVITAFQTSGLQWVESSPLGTPAVRRVLKQYTVPKTPKVPKPVPWNQVPREYLVPATETVPCSRYQHLIEKLENRTELSGSSWKSFSAVTTLLGALPS